MKKENITLVKFLSVMLLAAAAGIAAGRLSLPLAQGRLFMPQGLFLGPVLAVISLISLIYIFIKHNTDFLQQTVILSITAFGTVLSGFCGRYSVADVPLVAVSSAVCFAVIMGGVLLHKAGGTAAFHTSAREKLCTLGIFMAMFVSVMAPVGPLPCLVCGCLWLIVVDKKL